MTTTTLKFGATSPIAAFWHGLTRLFVSTPQALSPAEEAAEVRDMARRLQATDPGFAADLYAAADRHEHTGA